MCAVDKLQTSGDKAFMDLFGGSSQTPLGNITTTHHPMRPRLIVRQAEESKDQFFTPANWGLVPFWAKDIKIGRNAFNARSDSLVEDKPMFRAAFKYRRCLLVATSYIEYREEQGKKVPYEFSMATGEPFAYAGLWESWQGEFESCSMVTTEPNSLVGEYHTRMPVILRTEDIDAWLSPKTPRNHLLSLLMPYFAEEMVVKRTEVHRQTKAKDSDNNLFT